MTDIDQTMSVRMAAAYLGTTEQNVRRKVADGLLRTVKQVGVRRYGKAGKVRRASRWPDVYLSDLDTVKREVGRPAKPDYSSLSDDQAIAAIRHLAELDVLDEHNRDVWAILANAGLASFPGQAPLCGYAGEECEDCQVAHAEVKRMGIKRPTEILSGDVGAIEASYRRRVDGRKTGSGPKAKPSITRDVRNPRLASGDNDRSAPDDLTSRHLSKLTDQEWHDRSDRMAEENRLEETISLLRDENA